MMDGVEVARQITFDDPAALRVRAILQLHPHCTNRMMNTAFGAEAVGTRVEVTLPNRLHGHQHRPLDNAVQQDRHSPIELHCSPVSLWGRLKSPIPFIRFAVIGLLS